MQSGRPRAQGRAKIPCPPGLTTDEDNSVVALEVTVATVNGDGSLKIDQRIPWVGWGAATATLHDLIGGAFRSPAREILRFETNEIGWIDPDCPLRLERRVAFPAARVFLEALILPCGERQSAELSAILRSQGRAQDQHAAGLDYARQLAERWASQCPARSLPLVNLRQDFLITRTADAPPTDPPDPALATEPPARAQRPSRQSAAIPT